MMKASQSRVLKKYTTETHILAWALLISCTGSPEPPLYDKQMSHAILIKVATKVEGEANLDSFPPLSFSGVMVHLSSPYGRVAMAQQHTGTLLRGGQSEVKGGLGHDPCRRNDGSSFNVLHGKADAIAPSVHLYHLYPDMLVQMDHVVGVTHVTVGHL